MRRLHRQPTLTEIKRTPVVPLSGQEAGEKMENGFRSAKTIKKTFEGNGYVRPPLRAISGVEREHVYENKRKSEKDGGKAEE